MEDPSLSLELKGLLSMIIAYGDDWEINIDELLKYTKETSREHITSLLYELKERGFLYE